MLREITDALRMLQLYLQVSNSVHEAQMSAPTRSSWSMLLSPHYRDTTHVSVVYEVEILIATFWDHDPCERIPADGASATASAANKFDHLAELVIRHVLP
jgi:hypothetical protein